jgi:hypothetical protein
VTSYENAFERFAEVEARDSSLLYETLSLAVADDDDILEIAEKAPDDQPAPNLLFAAVQYLLFESPGHELAGYYPSVSEPAKPLTDSARDSFRRFCLDQRTEIVSLLRSRRVQTNVVRRCSILLPAFEYVSRRCDRSTLGFVEVGPSAGLNLLWDRYGYRYGTHGRYGDGTSPVQLSCRVRGEGEPPLPETVPPTGERLGIDLNPLRVSDDEDVRWLRALVWPEHEERRALLESAVSIGRDSPPALVEGNALTDLESVCSRIPESERLCVFNTHALYQLTAEQRDEFADAIDELGGSRDLFWLDCEWYGDEPEVRLVEYVDGVKSTDTLALYDSHGEWLEWCR